jgi:hypothetical protein
MKRRLAQRRNSHRNRSRTAVNEGGSSTAAGTEGIRRIGKTAAVYSRKRGKIIGKQASPKKL